MATARVASGTSTVLSVVRPPGSCNEMRICAFKGSVVSASSPIVADAVVMPLASVSGTSSAMTTSEKESSTRPNWYCGKAAKGLASVVMRASPSPDNPLAGAP